MAEPTNITNAFRTCRTSLQRWHESPWDFSRDDFRRLSSNLPEREAVHLDTHPINHGLDKDDLRILFKILAKDLPECGRKRGAILRYIDAYKQPKQELGKNLYRFLKSK